MTADLLERLMADIIAVTERLVDSDPVDLSRLQTQAHRTRVERRRDHLEKNGKQAHGGMAKMGEGVHKTVC
jgi:glutamate decarboxylase